SRRHVLLGLPVNNFKKVLVDRFLIDKVAASIDGKVLEFFDCPGPRQGVEDLRELLHKMRALLIQHGCEAALEVLPANMEAQTKGELNKKAHSAVILCLASYAHFVDTLLYGREALTLEDVMATLNSKEIKERSKAKGDDDESLYVRGRTDRRDSHQSRGK
ncbi:hypothetical protein Tco_0009052, partial [Tanacetum coccineum]